MKYNRFLKTALIIIVIAVFGFFIQIDSFVISPSRAVDLKDLVSVENAVENDRGGIYLLTVTQQRATLLTAGYAYIHPHMEVNPMERVIPVGMDEDEYRELLAENMVESQYLAQVVALRRAGYEVEIVSDGVEIVGFLEDAPARGYLEEEDKITFIDGEPVFLATEVPLLVQNRAPGDEVMITIMRNDREQVLSVPTGVYPDDDQMPFLGIYIQTMPWEPVIPVAINMNTGRIGGPSAGLMFVLEIMNQLLPEDITGGKDIAGTGTIDLNEKIGRIGGVPQKLVAAERAGIDYFFIAEGNYEQAMRYARNIEVIPVSTLGEVLDYLENIGNQ